MENWPVSLQQKLNVDNFTMQYGDTTVTSEVDAGVPKKRSRYTDGMDVYTCSVNLDFADQATLKTFYKTTLANGTKTFAFDDPFTEEPAEFRFAAPPSITPLGNGGRAFKVSMSWEKMP